MDIELATVNLNPMGHSEEILITQEWGGSCSLVPVLCVSTFPEML